MEKIAGVYKIINIVNDKCYIGSAININQRWSVHRSRLDNNKHHSAHLQSAWNKYGEGKFEFKVLEYCEKERLIEREQFFIDSEHPEYNILPTAGSRLGSVTSEETKRKLSEAQKGERGNMFGKHLSEETRKKISESKSGENNPCYGKHLSEETRRKISETKKGRSISEEHKQKISEALLGENSPNFGRHLSEETRNLLRVAKKGKPNGRLGKHLSEETKRKLSEAQKRRWAQ